MRVDTPLFRTCATGLTVALTTLLVACSSAPARAPVEERSPTGPTLRPSATPAALRPAPQVSGPAPTAASSAPVNAPAGAQPAAGSSVVQVPPPPPGSYVVKPGDTLIRIGLDNGQNWRDIARWNGIQNPNVIEVGQVLRVLPPGQDPPAAVSRPVQAAVRPESRPLEARSGEETAAAAAPSALPDRTAGAASGAAGTAPATAAPSPVPGTPSAQAASSTLPTTAATPRTGDEAVEWAWPAAGKVNLPFDEARGVKGLSIAGKAGDPVLAAADGRVVYAGSGLRGYGNLVIVKHNNTYLTAYAHNQALLVKEDQAVRRGQKIAEMGSSDADQVKLHFEIRRLGKPVDPARLLPTR